MVYLGVLIFIEFCGVQVLVEGTNDTEFLFVRLELVPFSGARRFQAASIEYYLY